MSFWVNERFLRRVDSNSISYLKQEMEKRKKIRKKCRRRGKGGEGGEGGREVGRGAKKEKEKQTTMRC